MDRQLKISPAAMAEVDQAMEDYCRVVLDSYLSMHSQHMYINNAENFVRWLKGEFKPGSRVDPYPRSRRTRTASGSDRKK